MKVRRLYTFYCIERKPVGLVFKIGISGNVAERMAQIQYELRQKTNMNITVREAWAIPVAFPEGAERWMHRFFAAISAKMPYHRGHTEWFNLQNKCAAFAYLVLQGYIGDSFTIQRAIIAAAIFCLPFPLDGVLLQVVVAAAQVAAGLFGLYLALCLLGAVFTQ